MRGSPLNQLRHYVKGECFGEASLLNLNYLCFLKSNKDRYTSDLFPRRKLCWNKNLRKRFFFKGKAVTNKKEKNHAQLFSTKFQIQLNVHLSVTSMERTQLEQELCYLLSLKRKSSLVLRKKKSKKFLLIHTFMPSF